MGLQLELYFTPEVPLVYPLSYLIFLTICHVSIPFGPSLLAPFIKYLYYFPVFDVFQQSNYKFIYLYLKLTFSSYLQLTDKDFSSILSYS